MVPKDDHTTRNRLLTAGIKVFAEKGFRDATVREICRQAGSSNINSINYYFGNKEQLYREILELIFKKYDLYKDPNAVAKTPEEKLRVFISAYCKLLYEGGALESDLTSIFVAEMAKPSPFLEEMVDRYNRPRVQNHLNMIRGILGPDASEETVRNCLVSISGQILYYSFAWPVFSRLFPGDSKRPVHDKWAEHVFRFSMGGLMVIKAEAEKTRRAGK